MQERGDLEWTTGRTKKDCFAAGSGSYDWRKRWEHIKK